MQDERRLHSPLAAAPGPPSRWATVIPERTVLGIIHNVTSATRLLDLLAVFDGDPRVQVYFTCTGSSPFTGGIEEFIAAHELPCLSWDEARKFTFDLAISTSRGGALQEISAPIIGTPHGAGYNKMLDRKPETGNRKPETGNRKPDAYGLAEEWLKHNGELIPAAIVLSHDEQRERLRHGCPEAVPVSHVIGDPCADQLQFSAPFREEYRTALGIRPDQKLVLLTSTWGTQSSLGRNPSPTPPPATPKIHTEIIRRALAELPLDEYRVIAAIHPNAWHWHGGWQIRSWLKPYVRAGLLVPHPESDTWKAAICAADAFIGDHGSLTLYAAAHGLPGLLASFDDDCVAADSPMARLGALLPRVTPSVPLQQQLAHAARQQPADPRIAQTAALVTARPGEALARLRALCYAHLDLPEPPDPVAPRPVSLPEEPTTPHQPPVAQPLYVATHLNFTQSNKATEKPNHPQVLVRRYPAALQGERHAHLADPHIVIEEGEPDSRWANVADIVVARRSTTLAAEPATAARAVERLFARHPGCSIVAVPSPSAATEDRCTLHLRDGREFTAHWGGTARWAEPAVAASILHAWLTHDEDENEDENKAEADVDGKAAEPDEATEERNTPSKADEYDTKTTEVTVTTPVSPLPLLVSLQLSRRRPAQPPERLHRLDTPQPPIDDKS